MESCQPIKRLKKKKKKKLNEAPNKKAISGRHVME
jgi:hypothetical protein